MQTNAAEQRFSNVTDSSDQMEILSSSPRITTSALTSPLIA